MWTHVHLHEMWTPAFAIESLALADRRTDFIPAKYNKPFTNIFNSNVILILFSTNYSNYSTLPKGSTYKHITNCSPLFNYVIN